MGSQTKSLQNGRNLFSNEESLFGSCISPLTIDSRLDPHAENERTANTTRVRLKKLTVSHRSCVGLTGGWTFHRSRPPVKRLRALL